MKIVYLSSSTVPSRSANSIHVMKMCHAFSKIGLEVVLVVPKRQTDIERGVNSIYQFYGIDKCFTVIYKLWLPVIGRGYIYGFLSALLAKQLRADIVYARNIPGCFFSILFGLSVILESHTPLDQKKHISRWMFNQIIKSPNLKTFVVITRALKEYYCKKYAFLEKKMKVAPDGADIVKESIQPIKLPGSNSTIQVGYIGHLYKGKGMEVISQLVNQCPWATFHVVGGKDDDIKFWKNRCKKSRNIIFHGFVPQKETIRYIKAFDVALLPNQRNVYVNADNDTNISDWTSPLKAFEYMAGGKAIICSSLPVLYEIFKSDHNAILCDPEDISEWVHGLKKIMNDHGYAAQLGNNAKNDFLEHYTWHKRVKSIIANISMN